MLNSRDLMSFTLLPRVGSLSATRIQVFHNHYGLFVTIETLC